MFNTNRILWIRRFPVKSRRYYSSSQITYPFAKLRAYPFQISSEDAIVQMAPYASSICLFNKILGSVGARFLPGFGFEPFRPVRITPVYFPGWMIDAEVSLDVRCGDVQHRTTGVTQNSYLPGSDFRVLSWISYRREPSFFENETVPFTEELTHQHGADVTCLPYTISPFAALDIAKSATNPIELEKDINLVPTSIDSHLFAAYPVLFPLYLAQYEYPLPGKERLMTLFIEASTANGRIRSEKLDIGEDLRSMWNYAPKALVDFTHALDDVDIPCLNDTPARFFDVFGFHLPGKRAIASSATRWLNDTIVGHGAGQLLVEKSGTIASDSDPRIRPYTSEEREAIQKWLLLGQEIESMMRVIVSMRETHDRARALTAEKVFPEDIFDKSIKHLESKIAELRAEHDATTPTWLKEWQHMSQ